MGQTLTHGVYLPDEGERNCYSGLAANWQILDTSVGTIAAHTAALAGKAPLVHTHTKADITDFPAYGNAAGTICEGNDSRLSDARTPVAHTHTKSDVTDLLNSNFIPSANNSYDLGSSSYQWNNLYANNYYYNGTAWGLDKSNVWTGNQYFRKTIIVQNSVAVSAGDFDIGINFFDSVGNRYGYIQPYITTGNQKRLMLGCDTGELSCNSDLIPANNNLNCGNSTLKWKSLNGINPGALSIFNPSATQDPIDVPNTWVTDGSAWNTLNVSNMGDGWICLTYKSCGANDYILARFGGTSATTYPSMIFPTTRLQDSKYYLYILIPVAKAMGNIYLEIKLDSNAVLVKHSFIPAYGTV